MLKIVNNLPLEYQFDKELLVQSEKYFMNGNQTTVLALDGDSTITNFIFIILMRFYYQHVLFFFLLIQILDISYIVLLKLGLSHDATIQ